MKGRITKGVGGLYYVNTDAQVFECKAKGIFRNRKIKPMVGDYVEISVLSGEQEIGCIEDILPRKNELYRPVVANVDQALIIFATLEPEPNFNLLDRFLITMAQQRVATVICFNKTDRIDEERLNSINEIYRNSGHRVCFVSALKSEGTRELSELLKGKTTVLAGPSGVGKSTLTNYVQSLVIMNTGELSEKIKRGKHTTRHTELIPVEKDTYIIDTPGFTSLYIEKLEKEELKDYYAEFEPYYLNCRFNGCVHIDEPDCAVKEAVEQGKISAKRYENYKQLYYEIKNKKKY